MSTAKLLNRMAQTIHNDGKVRVYNPDNSKELCSLLSSRPDIGALSIDWNNKECWIVDCAIPPCF